MCRKVVSVAMLLLASWVSCWGEARPSASTDQRSAINALLSQPLSTLWQITDESLTIIEESLIAQGEPVESLSINLDSLYLKSQELQGSVNALSQRLESLEGNLSILEKNMNQAIKGSRVPAIELRIWKTVAVLGISVSITSIIFRLSKICTTCLSL